MKPVDVEKQNAVRRSLTSAEKARLKIQQDTVAFLAAGNKITKIRRGIGKEQLAAESATREQRSVNERRTAKLKQAEWGRRSIK